MCVTFEQPVIPGCEACRSARQKAGTCHQADVVEALCESFVLLSGLIDLLRGEIRRVGSVHDFFE